MCQIESFGKTHQVDKAVTNNQDGEWVSHSWKFESKLTWISIPYHDIQSLFH
jgi:hypothetical protein